MASSPRVEYKVCHDTRSISMIVHDGVKNQNVQPSAEYVDLIRQGYSFSMDVRGTVNGGNVGVGNSIGLAPGVPLPTFPYTKQVITKESITVPLSTSSVSKDIPTVVARGTSLLAQIRRETPLRSPPVIEHKTIPSSSSSKDPFDSPHIILFEGSISGIGGSMSDDLRKLIRKPITVPQAKLLSRTGDGSFSCDGKSCEYNGKRYSSRDSCCWFVVQCRVWTGEFNEKGACVVKRTFDINGKVHDQVPDLEFY